MEIGSMPMPPAFRYRDVFLKGRPRHDVPDPFSLRHPPMPASRWAKIFAPFDALKGFEEAIRLKEAPGRRIRPRLLNYPREELQCAVVIIWKCPRSCAPSLRR